MTNVQIIFPDPLPEIILLEKAKKQLRVETDFTDEDDLIKNYITASVMASEDYMSCHVYAKSMVISLNAFRPTVIFEAFPLRGVKSVKYWSDDVEMTMPETDYYLTSQNLKQSQLHFKVLPTTDKRYDAVSIELEIGYENASKVPAPIKQAILLQIADMYERREDRAGVIHTSAQALMRPYRKYT